MDYFNPQMDIREINNLSMLGLAHVGDAVYELMTRTLLCTEGHAQANDLHHRTVEYVNASFQAKAAAAIQDLLTDEEMGKEKYISALNELFQVIHREEP